MEFNRITDLGPATIESYSETRRMLLRTANELTVRIGKLEPVRSLEDMENILTLDKDRKLVIEMIASCSYIIEWLETGRRPGNRRGIERRAGYQREIPTDPDKLPMVIHTAMPQETGQEVPKESRFRLEAALRGLTERERNCYTLALGESYSHAEIAALLSISKSSVGTYMVRAQRKVTDNIGSMIVLVG
ncbi:sigma factor-like helix-turn-helix DNA-binding protein [Cohnella lupini]|uniref:RNA polymerase sigma factor (Sigma-70 family) n=1 Tax=Cohnella lupini TaxID=1294267 RepID=A0A3D9ISN8_9BACL|nr:sigma factor-like helix-turn-helix DNA-binding protein [Cohnella lupini]RED64667.1 RNA polymerase sigma factor (sigma-70 family) [Cohnella lupini]